jgi:hypothetical protein
VSLKERRKQASKGTNTERNKKREEEKEIRIYRNN